MSIGTRSNYNGQYNGSGGWPNNGRYDDGDSGRYAWCSGNKNYVLNNDGLGPNGILTSGRNIFLEELSANFTGPAGGQLYTLRNSLDDFGTITQINTNGWSDGKHWKSGGLYCDGGVMYMVPYRQGGLHFGDGSIMRSLDGGVSWCSPAHTDPSGNCTITPSATGDAPTNGQTTLDFTGMRDIEFVQYGMDGGTWPLVDDNDIWIYGYLQGDLIDDIYPIRIRRTEMKLTNDGTKIQFKKSTGSCLADAGWSSNQADKSKLVGGTNITGNIMYIRESGYYVMEAIGATGDAIFYASHSPCGPFLEIGRIAFGGVAANTQAWFAPVIQSISTSVVGTNYVTTVLWVSSWAVDGRTGSPETNKYTHQNNVVTFTSPVPRINSVISTKVTIGQGVTIQ